VISAGRSANCPIIEIPAPCGIMPEPLELTSRIGDRGQSQSKIAQRPQARQCIIKQPPGSPDGCRPALLAPDNLTLAEELTPAREEVFGALPQHRLKADLSG
jgi:hypothetical protein